MNTTENTHQTQPPGTMEISSDAELYIVIGFLAFLSIMGTAGNALVLYVFAKKKDKLVSTLFIIVLASVDFITCLFVIPFTIFMEYVKFVVNYDALCKIYQFLITSNIPFSAMIMVAIAIDRYFCICHPFFHGLNLDRAKYVTGGLALFAIGLGVVVSLMYSAYHPEVKTVDTADVSNASGLDTTVITSDNITSYTSFNENRSMSVTNRNVWGAGSQTNFETVEVLLPVTVDQINTTISNESVLTTVITNTRPTKQVYTFTGLCDQTDKILSLNFQSHYQKFYYLLFILCLVIVIVLYTLIYKSVLRRRSKRQKQKSKALHLIQNDTVTHTSPDTLLTVVNGDALSTSSYRSPSFDDESRPAIRPSGKLAAKCQKKNRKNSLKRAQKQKTAKKDRTRMANLKTAAMLFVVTLVFVVTFFPAFLMALGILQYNMVVFYLYFANNVANPVIYSFMNKNFREDVKKLFCR